MGELPAPPLLSERYPRVRRLLGPVLLLVAAITYVGIHTAENQALSPFDELMHFDYVEKVPTQFFVPYGDELGDAAKDAYACRGVVFSVLPENACSNGHYIPGADLPFEGKSLAAGHTPLYFTVSWALAQPFEWFGVSDHVDAYRLANVFWLGAGVLLLYGMLRELGITRRMSTGLGFLLIAAPATFWSNAFLSIDGSAYVVGAGYAWMALRYLRGKAPWWALLVLAPVASLLKFQNLGTVGLVSLTLLLLALVNLAGRRALDHGPRNRGLILVSVATLATATAVQYAWQRLSPLLAVGDVPNDGVSVPFGLQDLASEIFGVLFETPSNAGYGGGFYQYLGTPLVLLCIAGVIAMVVLRPVAGPYLDESSAVAFRTLPIAVLVSTLTWGAFQAIALVAASGRYFNIPPRYSLSLFPMMLAMTGLLFDRAPWARWAMIGGGFALYLAGLVLIP